jgi:uncharacterized membrane protein HdeD (DUF308 family)
MSAVVSIALGFYVLMNISSPSAVRLGVVLGFDLLTSGIAMIMLGRSLHRASAGGARTSVSPA